MAKYESNVKQIMAPVEVVYDKLSNLENLQPIIDTMLSDDQFKERMAQEGLDTAQLEMLRNVQLTADSLTLPTGMMGDVMLNIIEREPNKTIKFETQQSPVEANIWIQVLPVTDTTSKMRLTLKAEMNPMIKMMIGSKIEQGIEGLADMLAHLPY